MANVSNLAALLVALLSAVTFVDANVLSIEEPFVPSDPDNPGSKGTKFVVAFMQNIIPRDAATDVPDAYIMVSTNEIGVVEFDVMTRLGGNEETNMYQVNSTHPTRINFNPDDFYVTGISDSDKAIWIQTKNEKKIAVFVINDEPFSTDGFLALPCDGMTAPGDFRTYSYLILGANQDTTGVAGSTARASQFLIITCEDSSTLVTVTPTTTVSGSGVFPNNVFGPVSSSTSSSATFGAKTTILISKTNTDFTGTLVRGSKPLVVVAGHQCGQVPESVTACDHMAAQIPPHTTWGYTFLLNPLAGRGSGDFYRFGTLLDNTQVTITCVDAGGSDTTIDYQMTLSSAVGSNWDTFETHDEACGTFVPKYCSLQSTNPVVVAQYSYSHTRDEGCNGERGDPFMSVIPPIVQYLRIYHLVPVDGSAGPFFKQVGISVYIRYFQPSQIMFDDAPFEADASLWQAIYCTGGEICGYAHTKSLGTDNNPHIIYHENERAAIFVHSYGYFIENSYALAGGMELQRISGPVISCAVPEGCVMEGSSVRVTCTRSQDLSVQSRIRVGSRDGTATASADYVELSVPVDTPNYRQNNVLNYRGNNRDSDLFFDVQVRTDTDDLEPPENFFIDVEPARTAIVFTPVVTVTICGVGGCPVLENPANGVVMTTGLSPGDTATYTCDPGYELVGTAVQTCGNNGEWSDVPPTCRPVCPTRFDPENGMVLLTGMSVGDTATYTCDTGFELIGESVLNCQSDGTWNNPPPICDSSAVLVSFDPTAYTVTEGVDMVALLTLVRTGDLSTETVVTVTTSDESAMEGSDYTSIVTDVTFAVDATTATVDVPILNDNEIEDPEIFYADLSTSDSTVTIQDGRATVTILDIDECPALDDIPNGSVNENGFTTGDTADYSCDEGYELVGEPTRVCQSDSTWSGEVPVCQSLAVLVSFAPTAYTVTEGMDGFVTLMLVRTGDLSRTTLVTVTTAAESAVAGSDYSSVEIEVLFEVGVSMATVGVSIINDTEIEGPEMFTADLSSTALNVMVGDGTATVTILDNDGCPALSDIPNGSVMVNGFGAGDTAVYSCDEGYELVGEPTRVCQSDSTWSGEPPTCAAACPILISPGNGSISASSGNLDGDTITFECNDGFTLVGERTLTCGSDGQWSSPMPPVCIPALAIERVNDTVIGDPLFTVALEGGAGSMCYEVRGEPGLYLNLISDTCTSVNALYDSVPGNERLNRMSKIGINAVVYANRIGGCAEIEISVQNCTATLNGFPVDPVAEIGDIRMLKTANHWRVSVSNCERPKAVMWVTCAGEMLRFRIARGSSLAPTSHGLLGQFWGIPVSFSQEIDQPPYIDIFPVGQARHRHVPFFEHDLTWDHSKTTCYYVGNKQGGPELSHDSDESVIEGNFKEYSTGSLFGTAYKYSQFNDDICEVVS
jgi:CUB/sushi domain-containing protein